MTHTEHGKGREEHEHEEHEHAHKPYAVWLVIAILIICTVVPTLLILMSIPKLP
ncbi:MULTISPECIES: hypothetical protein [Candidatus Nitrosocaldus]|jgi:hypothetical protein|uniref:Uncharacterized protein n=1 Tax=Candidatus Nitrosocaldus cavascurensis TaxID=2058097 RepID=A0A2K5ARQ2_9ARCH|nr:MULTISPECIES: hypothetical protein [Candidatus Nitrosocaldus]SPC34326.1 conserved protein of unknown function [Candidatus Nitrosocaldus cavascurensis]